MGLFAPWFLAGIVAVAVPLYVHLLRRHTTTPRPFSSLMFFERRTQSSIKHRRLRYLLLLSLRTALAAAARAGVCESVHQSLGGEHGQRQTAAAGHRQFLQHARRNAPGRRAPRGAFGSVLPEASRSRPSHGARLPASGALPSLRRMRARCAPPSRALQPGDSRANFGELARGGALACGHCAARPSSFISSATCRNPRCPQASRNWLCPQMFRSFCIRWSKSPCRTGRWKASTRRAKSGTRRKRAFRW